jgi:CheY-like chemotaxis protein
MPSEKKTILIIDDEPDVLDYLTALLEDNGYATVTAKDGIDGLTKVKQVMPSLVTLDITMPEKSGVGFYREMKESDEYKDIPIVMITGISKDFEKFISSRRQVPPPEGYISKPIDREQVLSLIGKLA